MVMLLGKKVGMTQVYNEAGKLVPVTVIQAGPCAVMQVKTTATDGYDAIQLGYDDVKPSRRKKPAGGHAQKAGTTPKKFVREMRLEQPGSQPYQPGQQITVSAFAEVKFVDVTGTTKGKGFTGVMKRHGFKGMPSSHGTERKHRSPGSIASFGCERGRSGGPKRGKRMAGHAGSERATSRNHQLISIDDNKNLLVVKGTVAGSAGAYVVVRSSLTDG
jgi:large subunit ribosomal protein L3